MHLQTTAVKRHHGKAVVVREGYGWETTLATVSGLQLPHL